MGFEIFVDNLKLPKKTLKDQKTKFQVSDYQKSERDFAFIVNKEIKAQDLINLLLETNKIACGTFNKIQSSYIWKEELIEESELEVSLYTKESLMYEVVDIVKKRHSYDLPKITVIEPVYTLPEYEEWVKNSTT